VVVVLLAVELGLALMWRWYHQRSSRR